MGRSASRKERGAAESGILSNRSARSSAEDQLSCGSYLKGCMTCGNVRYAGKCKECGTEIHSTEEILTAACETSNCRERPIVKPRKYYTSGCSVRKAYSPKAAGWTYCCYMCGARDENCWEGFVGERGLGNAISGANTRKCSRILQLLKVAEKPEDMEITGLHFHGVKGDPKRWSLCATGNDRITFGWVDEKAADVYFEDYQQGGSKIMERKSGRPVHPGAIIKQDILPAVQLSVTAAAKALGVSPKTLQEILKKRKPLSTIMCWRGGRHGPSFLITCSYCPAGTCPPGRENCSRWTP